MDVSNYITHPIESLSTLKRKFAITTIATLACVAQIFSDIGSYIEGSSFSLITVSVSICLIMIFFIPQIQRLNGRLKAYKKYQSVQL